MPIDSLRTGALPRPRLDDLAPRAAVISVLLAYDHPIFREGVKSILAGAGDVTVAGEASSAEETLEQVRSLAPDVVVLDPRIAGRDGLATIGQLARRRPRARLLILSAHPEDRHAVSCLEHGADGYVVKDVAPQQLVAAIRQLHAGGKVLTPRLAEELLRTRETPPPAAPAAQAGLSRRQLEVMRLLGSGLTSRQIASRLELSVNTISTHRARILCKLDLSTTAALLRYAIELELSATAWAKAIVVGHVTTSAALLAKRRP